MSAERPAVWRVTLGYGYAAEHRELPDGRYRVSMWFPSGALCTEETCTNKDTADAAFRWLISKNGGVLRGRSPAVTP